MYLYVKSQIHWLCVHVWTLLGESSINYKSRGHSIALIVQSLCVNSGPGLQTTEQGVRLGRGEG